MAEEVKEEQQSDSADTANKPIDDNPPVDKEQDPQPAEGKSIDPEDQTFWEDSVDANSVDISDGQTEHEEATEENQPADKEPEAENGAEQVGTQVEEETAPSDNPPAEEAHPEEQESAAEMDTEEEKAQAEGKTPDPDTAQPEETPAPAEETQEPDGDANDSSTEQGEDADSTSSTPDSPEDEGKDHPAEQAPAAEMDGAQEEAQTEGETADADTPPAEKPPAPAEEDNAAAASEEPHPKGKVLSFYRRLNKKTLIAGSGILLLIAGSIGFTVVPGLRSSDSITSTFLGGMPETAYDMKFFLPLDVGYEKSQFVKVTIALELMDEGLHKEIDKNISQLRKEVIDLILTKSPKEVKSSSGKQELSREITSRINNYLSKDCIKGTYFTELVIL